MMMVGTVDMVGVMVGMTVGLFWVNVVEFVFCRWGLSIWSAYMYAVLLLLSDNTITGRCV